MESTEYYEQIVSRMGELHKHLRQLQNRMLEEHQISLMEYHILAVVLRSEDTSQNELAEALDVDKALISRQIQSMEQKGLLSSRTDPACRRKKLLSPSPEALALIPQLNELHRQSLDRVFSDIDEKQLEIFTSVLEGLVSKL